MDVPPVLDLEQVGDHREERKEQQNPDAHVLALQLRGLTQVLQEGHEVADRSFIFFRRLQARTVQQNGGFLIAFGILAPIPLASIGAALGVAIGLSVGGATLLAVLAGSASYIAAPAAMRIAVPEANPSLSLAASLGVTFPFNIVVGIPIYHSIAQWAHSLGA